MTEDPNGLVAEVEVVPLPVASLVGWWNKLCLFKAGVFPPTARVVYFDLDVVIVGNIDFIVEGAAPLVICAGFGGAPGFNSSVFSFVPRENYDLFEDFFASHEKTVEQLKGDQDWIFERRPNASVFAAKKILSFKEETNSLAIPFLNSFRHSFSLSVYGRLRRLKPLRFQTATVPKDCAVVAFHGKPDPEDVADGSYGFFRKAPYIQSAWS